MRKPASTKSNHFFLGGVYLGRSAPSPDLSRVPFLFCLATFPCFCVGVPFILTSYKYGMIHPSTNCSNTCLDSSRFVLAFASDSRALDNSLVILSAI